MKNSSMKQRFTVSSAEMLVRSAVAAFAHAQCRNEKRHQPELTMSRSSPSLPGMRALSQVMRSCTEKQGRIPAQPEIMAKFHGMIISSYVIIPLLKMLNVKKLNFLIIS
jgi:hypothetical protein